MTRLRFVHSADLQLDSPFGGLRSLAPEIAETLYQATFKAYDNIIDLCIQEQVDALLIAGDIGREGRVSSESFLEDVDMDELARQWVRFMVRNGVNEIPRWPYPPDFPSGK